MVQQKMTGHRKHLLMEKSESPNYKFLLGNNFRASCMTYMRNSIENGGDSFLMNLFTRVDGLFLKT